MSPSEIIELAGRLASACRGRGISVDRVRLGITDSERQAMEDYSGLQRMPPDFTIYGVKTVIIRGISTS